MEEIVFIDLNEHPEFNMDVLLRKCTAAKIEPFISNITFCPILIAYITQDKKKEIEIQNTNTGFFNSLSKKYKLTEAIDAEDFFEKTLSLRNNSQLTSNALF